MTQEKDNEAGASEAVAAGSTSDEFVTNAAETGPFYYTFTARLPIVLSIVSGFEVVSRVAPYASAASQETFSEPPVVRIRFANHLTPDRKYLQANMSSAVQGFYGVRNSNAQSDPFSGDNGIQLYEQWVTLETPGALLVGESEADGGYAFHRSLASLNFFLTAYSLARWDSGVRVVSARELRPIILVGRLDLHGNWEEVGPMLMFPDAQERVSLSITQLQTRLSEAEGAVLTDSPFVRTFQWRARAERRQYEGDAADSIVSFQVAAETLLYELWGLLLRGRGLRNDEISTRREQVSFASLVKRELPKCLGGSWDTTARSRPVGLYWNGLYLLRNRIIHGAYLPHDGDALTARHAFHALDAFIDERLQAAPSKYAAARVAKLEASYLQPPRSNN